MTGIDGKRLEDMSLSELLTPFFKCASIAMNVLNKMLPDGAEMTLIVRFPKIDNNPLIVSSDDLNEVQKALARVNDPATQGDYHVTYTNPAMQGRPN